MIVRVCQVKQAMWTQAGADLCSPLFSQIWTFLFYSTAVIVIAIYVLFI